MKLKKKTNVLSQMWQELLLAAIGEIFEEPDVVGVTVAIRTREDLLSVRPSNGIIIIFTSSLALLHDNPKKVWNGNNSSDAVRFGIGEKLRYVLNLDPSTLM